MGCPVKGGEHCVKVWEISAHLHVSAACSSHARVDIAVHLSMMRAQPSPPATPRRCVTKEVHHKCTCIGVSPIAAVYHQLLVSECHVGQCLLLFVERSCAYGSYSVHARHDSHIQPQLLLSWGGVGVFLQQPCRNGRLGYPSCWYGSGTECGSVTKPVFSLHVH